MAKLTPEQLSPRTDPAQIPFDTSADARPLTGLVGQERAVEAIEFAIGMRHEGYNLFVFGPPGTGKHTLIRHLLAAQAAADPVPSDWAYVHNFQNPGQPVALRLPPGRAAPLAQAMRRLVQELRAALPAAFEGDDYRQRREVVDEQFKQRQERAFVDLSERAQKEEVALVRTPTGLALAPARDGEVMPPDAFRALPQADQDRFKAAMERYQEELEAIVRKLPEWEREHRELVRQLNRDVTRFAVAHLIEEVRKDYLDLTQVQEFLDAVERDVMENARDFLPSPQQGPEAMMGLLAAGGAGNGEPASGRRYQVNVFVDHAGAAGAPVVYEDHPTHQSLVGRIEHQARFGALFTDFNLMKPGALHAANGGYLVLDAYRILANGFAWESLKRALAARRVKLESLEAMLSMTSTVMLEPEPIPLDVKVVLIGPPNLYYLLAALDPDFGKLFKVSADFDDRMPRDGGNTALYARLIAASAVRAGVRPVDRGGMARLIDHAARMTGDAERLSLRVRILEDLLQEADWHACRAGSSTVDAEAVQRAIDAQRRRSDRIYSRALEEMQRRTFLVETDGSAVGQINGLAVQSIGGFAFGLPSRITARVRLGAGEVLDIERQAELGGPLHSKGVMILTGFLGGRFGATRRLALSATLVFEQSYGGVDGDSASSTELYALLSAIGEIPLKQSIAVTGSVDQRGQVQPIGGVNEKIEGFFDVCAARGLTGGQGVMIPATNVKNLMVRPDVAAAVAAGRFHVWAVSTVDEGIEILTGMPAGEPDAGGNWPAGTVNHAVARRLAKLAERADAQGLTGRGNGKARHGRSDK
ncbi:Lon protease family protein [Stella sp.]|uniref:Lon protease family protein n=1 Tax=Stella sp. TaxID=2912054 RepID=UPI0035AFAEFD